MDEWSQLVLTRTAAVNGLCRSAFLTDTPPARLVGEMSMNSEVFPASFQGVVRTSDAQLDRLLRKVHSKVCERVLGPGEWSTMQRAAGLLFDEARGLRSPAELARALAHFNVQLPQPELAFLFASFVVLTPDDSNTQQQQRQGGGDNSNMVARFDWRQFAAFLFPTLTGDVVAPRYGLTSRADTVTATPRPVQLQQQQPQQQPSQHQQQPAGNAFGFAPHARFTNDMKSRTAPFSYGASATFDDPASAAASVYPAGAPLPPARVLAAASASAAHARNATAQQQEAARRTALHRAFQASQQQQQRGSATTARMLKQQQQLWQQRLHAAHVNPNSNFNTTAATTTSAASTSTFPAHRSRSHTAPSNGAAAMERHLHLSPSQAAVTSFHTSLPRVAHAGGRRADHGPPTYMLPVPHRVSTAAASFDSSNPRSNSNSTSTSAFRPYQPYPDRVSQANGERVQQRKYDAYVVPGIQFGSAFKF